MNKELEFQKEFEKHFYSKGFEWVGIQYEYVAKNELWFYLDEISDKLLYEETIEDILKKLRKENKIRHWSLEKTEASWNQSINILIVKFG